MTAEHMCVCAGRSCVMRTYRTLAGPINLARLIIQACASAFNVIFAEPSAGQTARTLRRKGGPIATDILGIGANKHGRVIVKNYRSKKIHRTLLRAILDANLRHRKQEIYHNSVIFVCAEGDSLESIFV